MQGDLSALRQVMSQMGMDHGILDQVTPGAPTARPQTMQTLPTQPGMTAPGQGAMGQSLTGGSPDGMGQAPLTNVGQPQGQLGLPAGDPEAQIILKSLSKRLDTLGKLGR